MVRRVQLIWDSKAQVACFIYAKVARARVVRVAYSSGCASNPSAPPGDPGSSPISAAF